MLTRRHPATRGDTMPRPFAITRPDLNHHGRFLIVSESRELASLLRRFSALQASSTERGPDSTAAATVRAARASIASIVFRPPQAPRWPRSKTNCREIRLLFEGEPLTRGERRARALGRS
jgi:hypothetical protein